MMMTIQQLSRADSRVRLRAHAEELIREGTTVRSELGGGALGAEALELLYRWASDPDSAADALKLLHELQTHQVELDLLLEQFLASERDTVDDLAWYQSLYRHAPVAYLVVARDGRMMESNDAADSLLGIVPAQVAEHSLAQYLTLPSREQIAATLQTLDTPGASATCSVRLSARPEQSLAVSARLGPAGDRVLMTVSPRSNADLDASQP